MADIAGYRPSYIVYGPMTLAATSVLAIEGGPEFPQTGRPWASPNALDVNIFPHFPTAIPARKAGGDEPKNYNYPSST